MPCERFARVVMTWTGSRKARRASTISRCSRTQAAGRTLLTCDKDFGELAFRVRAPAISGIVLFRLAGLSPEEAVSAIIRSLESQQTWERVFAVVSRDRVRVVPLPNV